MTRPRKKAAVPRPAPKTPAPAKAASIVKPAGLKPGRNATINDIARLASAENLAVRLRVVDRPRHVAHFTAGAQRNRRLQRIRRVGVALREHLVARHVEQDVALGGHLGGLRRLSSGSSSMSGRRLRII